MNSAMHTRSFRAGFTVAAFLMPVLPALTFAAQPAFHAEVFPPWQHGQNNDATNGGLWFTVPQVDDLADFHGDITDPKLVLYVSGNYFFAMAPLVSDRELTSQLHLSRLSSLRHGTACTWPRLQRKAATEPPTLLLCQPDLLPDSRQPGSDP
jgi:hypothetical protein